MKLEVNGYIVKSYDLSSVGAEDDGTSTSGFNISDATSVQFSNGVDFDVFKYRTGTYRVDSSDMVLGWNYARVIHSLSSGDRETDYIDWVVDDDTNTVLYDNITFDDLDMSPTTFNEDNYLSGVKYHNDGIALYGVRIQYAQRNTYIPSGGITFSSTQGSISTENYPNYTNDYITLSGLTYNINNTRFLDQEIGVTTRANRPFNLREGSCTEAKIEHLLMDPYIDHAVNNLEENFNGEGCRLKSDSDFSNISLISNWDSTVDISDGGASGYNKGLLVTNGKLIYPTLGANSGNFSNIVNGPTSNVDYSGCTGERTYYRYFYDNSGSTGNFTITIKGTGSLWSEGDSFSGNKIKIAMKLPGDFDVEDQQSLPGTGWMNCTKSYSTNSWQDDAGCLDGTLGSIHETTPVSWGLTTGIKTTSATGYRAFIRITVPQAGTGSISNILFAFSG